MSTMKKLFALVLALAMMMSVAVFANAYGDTATIAKECKSAVNLLSAIGLVEGDNHGNFNPENTITRAEAAAIIYRLRNGGVDDKAAMWVGAEPFADVADTDWFAGYVAWCYNYGIIDGVSATAFNPKTPIKGTELAKMLLTTAGYKTAVEGYTGDAWEKNVIEDATAAGLFADYTPGFTKPCARQWAALMIVNALEAEEAQYLGDYRLPTGGEKLSVKYLGLAKETAYVVANDEWSITIGVAKAAEGKIKVSFEGINQLPNLTAGETDCEGQVTVLDYDLDNDMVGQQVVIAYKAGTTEGLVNAEKIYGIVATGKTNSGKVVWTRSGSSGTAGNANQYGFTLTVNGVKYLNDVKLDKLNYGYKLVQFQGYADCKSGDRVAEFGYPEFSVYLENYNANGEYAHSYVAPNVYYEHAGYRGSDMVGTGWDADGDGDLDRIIYNSAVYATVTGSDNNKFDSNTKTVTVTFRNGSIGVDKAAKTKTYTLKDVTVNGTLKVGAVVKVTSKYGKLTLDVQTPVIGVLSKVTGAVSTQTVNMVIGGINYKSGQEQTALGAYGLDHGKQFGSVESLLGKTVVTYLNADNRIIKTPVEYVEGNDPVVPVDPENIDTSKLAYLIKAESVTVKYEEENEWGISETKTKDVFMAKIMLADGSTASYTYDVDSTLDGAITDTTDLVAGNVYEYAIVKGELVLFSELSLATKVIYGGESTVGAADANDVGEDAVYNLEKNRFGDILVNDNTLIFVKYTKSGKAQYAVMKMSEFKSQIDGKTFKLIARNNGLISTALVASIDFGANNLPGAKPDADPEKDIRVVYTNGSAQRVNAGYDEDGNPINVDQFEAVDVLTGEALVLTTTLNSGVSTKTFRIVEIGEAVAEGTNGHVATLPAATTVTTAFAGLNAEGWFTTSVAGGTDEVLLIGGKLYDAESFTEDAAIMAKTGFEFEAATIADVSVGKDGAKNVVLHVVEVDGEYFIDAFLFTSAGDAF